MIQPIKSKILQLASHTGFKRYAGNVSWVLAERLLRMFVGLFVGIWIARYLGPAQFGLLSYAQSFVFLFTAVSTLGLDGIIIRELVKDEGRRDLLLGTAFFLKLFGALLVLPLIALAIYFTNNDYLTSLLIFIIASATVFQSFNVIDFYYQSKVLSKYVALANTISLGVSSVIKVFLLLNEASVIAFAVMTIFDAAILALGLIFYYTKISSLHLSNWKFNKKTAIKLLKNSWPLILSGLIVSMYMKVDQIMIKQMMSSEAVGQYAAAIRLSEAWYFIPMVVVSSLFPAIINAKKTSHTLYIIRLERLYTLMVWMAIAIALPVTFLSNWIVNLLYGSAYIEASKVLVIHIWAGVFVFLGVAFANYLTAENLVIKAFYRSIAGLIINIILNLFLIPIYGVLGAAIATLCGQLSANILYDVFDKSLWPQLRLKLRAFSPFLLIK